MLEYGPKLSWKRLGVLYYEAELEVPRGTCELLPMTVLVDKVQHMFYSKSIFRVARENTLQFIFKLYMSSKLVDFLLHLQGYMYISYAK